MDQNKFVNYEDYKSYPIEEMQQRSIDFLGDIQRRRTIRDFSSKGVPEEVIKESKKKMRAINSAFDKIKKNYNKLN